MAARKDGAYRISEEDKFLKLALGSSHGHEAYSAFILSASAYDGGSSSSPSHLPIHQHCTVNALITATGAGVAEISNHICIVLYLSISIVLLTA